MKKLLVNANIFTFLGDKALKGKQMNSPTVIENGCVLVENESISGVFPNSQLANYDVANAEIIDCKGNLVTAGLVDCHTHFVFGGFREKEFNMRLNGASYMEIMNAGGGIANTVEKTRNASVEQLINSALPRLNNYLQQGVTTIEGKSGYGLDIDTELKQFVVMEQLEKIQPVEIVQTYMGAHTTPKGSTTDDYVNFIIEEALPAIKTKTSAKYVDCFCEDKVFSVKQCRRILSKAKEMGFGTKVHAEEIVPLGGSALAVEMGSVSCEHLLHISKENILRLAKSDVIATLLPATAFSLRKNYAPARALIDSGCAVAVATDLNPGSCYTQSIPLIVALCCMYMQMSINETLCALTLNGAAAIGSSNKIGTLEKGKQADITIYNVPNANFLSYNFALNHVQTVIKKSQIVFNKN